ncbi:MAG: SUMF1/EgtB/PvdO family nonheme iron enzyme, partial [Sphaerochaetaceae bacterium]|nr:SUMF1/EgtB/PvdO family nonheme iron enzyme [Sphaerochaetaceae bacterium]
RVTFTSQAYNAAVYVDGIYEGGTPFEKKISSGNHQVSFQVNGVELDNFTVKVGHPFFFTWLFPRKMTVNSNATINSEAFYKLNKELLRDTSAYSNVLSYDESYPYPPIFTNYAKTILNSSFSNKIDVLKACSYFITTANMNEDFKEACSILGVTIDSPYDSLSNNQTIGQSFDLNNAITGKKTSLVCDNFTIEGFAIPSTTIVNGTNVKKIYPDIREAGNIVTVDAFNIGSICVTENQYAAFVQENPKWSLSNKANLIEEGLVDDYYLDGVTLSLSLTSNRPVRNVSYYSAQAFCQWLSAKTGNNVFLPTNDQWIASYLADTEKGFQKTLLPLISETGPSAMLGGLWELTSSYYIPLSKLDNYNVENLLTEYQTPTDIIVKGGSYVSSINDIKPYTIGTVYRELCSDYMGFRVAWI